MKKLSFRGFILSILLSLSFSTSDAGQEDAKQIYNEITPPEINKSRDEGFSEITAPEVKVMLDDGKSVVVNVLSDIEYSLQHISGSINIPVNYMETTQALPRDKKTHLVFYCMAKV